MEGPSRPAHKRLFQFQRPRARHSRGAGLHQARKDRAHFPRGPPGSLAAAPLGFLLHASFWRCTSKSNDRHRAGTSGDVFPVSADPDRVAATCRQRVRPARPLRAAAFQAVPNRLFSCLTYLFIYLWRLKKVCLCFPFLHLPSPGPLLRDTGDGAGAEVAVGKALSPGSCPSLSVLGPLFLSFPLAFLFFLVFSEVWRVFRTFLMQSLVCLIINK